MSARPEWALAYVLQDLTKRGRPALNRAYFAARDDADLELARTETEAALGRLRTYCLALEEAAALLDELIEDREA